MHDILSLMNLTDTPAEVQVDASNVILNVASEAYRPKSRHLNSKVQFIRETIARDQVVLNKVASKDNLADAATKPLPRIAFEDLFARMGFVKLPS